MFDASKLKEGDRVKVISEQGGNYVGRQGVIRSIIHVVPYYLVRVAFGRDLINFRSDYPKDVIEKVERLKVGDKVILTGEGFKERKGMQGVVVGDDHEPYLPYRVQLSNGSVFCDVKGEFSCIKTPERKKIIIYSVGNEVFAKLVYSDKSFAVASAKCNPSDNFDILVGAQIALQRLAKKLGSKLVLPTEALDAIDIEVKIKDKENFEVV